MPAIEDTIVLMGFAWLDAEGEVNWATQKDMEHLRPAQRPAGATPVVITIEPTELWTQRSEYDREFLGDVSDKINQFTVDLAALQKALKIGGMDG